MRATRIHLTLSLFVGALALTASASWAAKNFPPRNQCTDVPGHVKCFTEHDGLIHGAEITTPTYVLTCRAFRQLWLKRYIGRSSRAETREVVVAGVCEQRNLKGALIRRWDTLEPLKTSELDRSLWESIAKPTPKPVVTLVSQKSGKRGFKIFTGYYLPEDWDEKTFTDTSKPAGFEPFPPLGKVQAWKEEPSGALSVESPKFRFKPKCSSGFVVCSAYLKILHPDPQSSEVSVEMVSARRFFSFRTKHAKVFEHDATFLRQKLTAP